MDPAQFIDSAGAVPLPAPMWVIQALKVLGFILHMVPMNLWYAGTVVAMLLHASRNEHARRVSARLMVQMPVIIALGVNFGIVPLLFIQVAYAKFFYPATILMAWFWFSVFGLLIIAYYGVYIYAFGLKDNAKAMTPGRRAVGWASAVAFILIGFTFNNAMSLMVNVGAWPALFAAHNVAGAATGTALNVADASLWPRWLMLFGLALTTSAAWIGFDSAWFATRDSVDYRRWARGFAWKLHLVGLIWFAAAGSWYVFGTWDQAVLARMWSGPLAIHTALTGAAPGLALLLLVALNAADPKGGRVVASLVGLAQFGALAINAISRQMVQNLQLAPYATPIWQRTETQWSPMITFLVIFVLGLGLVFWMIAQAARAPANRVGQAPRA